MRSRSLRHSFKVYIIIIFFVRLRLNGTPVSFTEPAVVAVHSFAFNNNSALGERTMEWENMEGERCDIVVSVVGGVDATEARALSAMIYT